MRISLNLKVLSQVTEVEMFQFEQTDAACVQITEIKKKLDLNKRNNWQYWKLLNTVQSVFLPAVDNFSMIS